MKNELIKMPLKSDNDGHAHECQMSVELFQNARQTMGELRDFLRTSGLSWDFIQHEIELANRRKSPLDRALDSMDPYSTGPGRSLRDLPSNVW